MTFTVFQPKTTTETPKEKDSPRVTVTSNEEESDAGRDWKSGYSFRLPWISLVCLSLTLAFGAAIGVVLGVSDGEDVARWCSSKYKGKSYQITPNVWISGFIFIAGKLLALSFGEAVAIAWWVRAVKGRTLRQLHQDYESGRSIVSVVKSPKAFSFIGLGSIAFTAFAGVGIVLQKATSSAPSTYVRENVELSTPYAARLPVGFSGLSGGALTGALMKLSTNFQEVTRAWSANSPMQLTLGGCDPGSTCTTHIPGVGFEYHCTARDEEQQSVTADGREVPIPGFDIYYDTPGWAVDNDWKFKFNATWYNGVNDAGNVKLAVWQCDMIPALVDYPITVFNGTVNLLAANSSVVFTATTNNKTLSPSVDHVIHTQPKPDPKMTAEEGYLTFTLSGIVQMMSQYQTDFSLGHTGHGVATGFLAFEMIPENATASGPAFPEPITYLVGSLRDLMFRTSLMIAQKNVSDVPYYTSPADGSQRVQIFPGGVALPYTDANGTVSTPIAIYKTNYIFVIVGEALIVMCVVCILPLFWGYWRLGRKVSLAPLEMAQALNTPATVSTQANAFQHANGNDGEVRGSNADCRELVDMLGDVRVQYGEIAPGKLGLAVEDTVTRPTPGARYQ